MTAKLRCADVRHLVPMVFQWFEVQCIAVHVIMCRPEKTLQLKIKN